MYKFANDDEKDVKLDEDYTNIDLRHLLPGARIAALRGAKPSEQVSANWDQLGMGISGAAGAAGGGIGGWYAGKAIDKDKPMRGAVLGALTGAVGGGLLGQYLSFKALSHYRGTDPSYGWRHLLPGARVAALRGVPAEEQVEANWDHIKMHGGGVLGSVLSGSVVPGTELASLGSSLGTVGAYKILKDNRLKKQ